MVSFANAPMTGIDSMESMALVISPAASLLHTPSDCGLGEGLGGVGLGGVGLGGVGLGGDGPVHGLVEQCPPPAVAFTEPRKEEGQ